MKSKVLTLVLCVALCLFPAVFAQADETTENENTGIANAASESDNNGIKVSLDKKDRIVGDKLIFSIETGEDGAQYAAVTGCTVKEKKQCIIPEAVIFEGTRYEVLEIADKAFKGNTIQEITIPDGLKRIGNMAFFECEGLTSVVIPKKCDSIGYGAFMNCGSLANVDFNNTLCLEIGELAFAYTALTSVEMSDMTESLLDNCFVGCASLKTVYIGANCDNIGIGVFSDTPSMEKITKSKYNKRFKIIKGCIYTADGETLVSGAAAKGKLTLEKGVKNLCEYAFEGNSRIKTVTVPGTVKSVPEGCFMGCKALKKAVIKNGVKSVGLCSFGNDGKLATVSIPKSLKKIEGNPFTGCSKLNTITVSEKNAYFKVKEGVLCSADLKNIISAPTVSGSLDLWPECRKIEDYAFYENKGLEKITFNEGLKSVGYAAFYGCGSLQKVYFSSRNTVLCDNPKEYNDISGNVFFKCGEKLEISVPFSAEAGARGSLEDCIEENCDGEVMITQH